MPLSHEGRRDRLVWTYLTKAWPGYLRSATNAALRPCLTFGETGNDGMVVRPEVCAEMQFETHPMVRKVRQIEAEGGTLLYPANMPKTRLSYRWVRMRKADGASVIVKIDGAVLDGSRPRPA